MALDIHELLSAQTLIENAAWQIVHDHIHDLNFPQDRVFVSDVLNPNEPIRIKDIREVGLDKDILFHVDTYYGVAVVRVPADFFNEYLNRSTE